MVSSHCIISDDLKHDVSMVYKSQEKVLKVVKENSPHIEEVITLVMDVLHSIRINTISLIFPTMRMIST